MAFAQVRFKYPDLNFHSPPLMSRFTHGYKIIRGKRQKEQGVVDTTLAKFYYHLCAYDITAVDIVKALKPLAFSPHPTSFCPLPSALYNYFHKLTLCLLFAQMSWSCDVSWDWGPVWVLVWLHMQNWVAFLEVLLHCLTVNCEDKAALCVAILFHRLINLTPKV